ncbi:Zinc-binding GTPase YeiR [Vibrio stylophorae]|uniref:Zinc-binding GTPase YeiR n=1 Tax=Vibrio stylophorae TaxID=659351 RepID=A0ABM8ZTK1_9VIBR|nr:GTP-binding protein [Vibrio stylophorae]CAH0533640.1 Zinc-binding GTPase YeiR [Vibrio stylophorae]
MAVITNIITGFLGVGKTTAILHLLKYKPANEKWAVLVNEFGEIGIDGAMLSEQGAMIKEIPGGCLCCTAGVPMSVGITALLRQKPDRLLIEPTGLGHPQQVIATLTSAQYRDYIDLRATIALVDPRHLLDSQYTSHQPYVDQLLSADCLVASKGDCYRPDLLEALSGWQMQYHPHANIAQIAQGALPLNLLDTPRIQMSRIRSHQPAHDLNAHHHEHAAQEPQFALAPDQAFVRKAHQAQGYVSCGWIFGAEAVFDLAKLRQWFRTLPVERAKGVVNTCEGSMVFNMSDGMLSVSAMSLEGFESRIEVIHSQPCDWDAIECALISAKMD